MQRKMWDQIVSGAGAVMAVVLLLLGAVAIYGGTFGQDNVRDRLEPQNITFPPLEAMTPEETELVGDFAGQNVDDGPSAEAFSDYIGLHLVDINEGATYSETSTQARAEGLSDEEAGELQGKADSLFRGESLRAILLNAYGWWTVSSLAIFAGYGLIAAGILLAIAAFLGFRHARKVELKAAAPAKPVAA